MIKRLAVPMLASAPIWSLLRRRAHSRDPISILCYHTLTADQGGIDGWTALRVGDFRAQLADLRKHYDIISLDEALEAKPGRKPRAVLTFDDGDRGLYTHLLPVLRETGVPVTIYVATAQFETGTPFWFDRVVNALQGAHEIKVEGLGHWVLPAEPGVAHWMILGEVLEALKQAPTEDRDALADQVAAQGRPPKAAPLGPMSMTELKELAATPGVTIGAHTHGHELLDQLDPEAARASMERSRTLLQGWTGQEVRHFAYPNGNHTEALREIAMELGFASATILEDRLVEDGADPFTLTRVSVGRYDSAARIRLRLVGL